MFGDHMLSKCENAEILWELRMIAVMRRMLLTCARYCSSQFLGVHRSDACWVHHPMTVPDGGGTHRIKAPDALTRGILKKTVKITYTFVYSLRACTFSSAPAFNSGILRPWHER